MAGTDGNGQCINFGSTHKFHGFIGIRDQLLAA
jgi:hypothetical protein